MYTGIIHTTEYNKYCSALQIYWTIHNAHHSTQTHTQTHTHTHYTTHTTRIVHYNTTHIHTLHYTTHTILHTHVRATHTHTFNGLSEDNSNTTLQWYYKKYRQGVHKWSAHFLRTSAGQPSVLLLNCSVSHVYNFLPSLFTIAQFISNLTGSFSSSWVK